MRKCTIFFCAFIIRFIDVLIGVVLYQLDYENLDGEQ